MKKYTKPYKKFPVKKEEPKEPYYDAKKGLTPNLDFLSEPKHNFENPTKFERKPEN